MTDDLERPFVPHGIPVDTRRRPTPTEISELRQAAKEGADRLHAQAKTVKPTDLTDAESTARARARTEKKDKP